MRKWKGYGFFVAMAAIILIAMISSDFMSGWTEENYTYTQFKDDLSNHKIQSVVVGQNEQVPTGEIRVTMKDSKKHSFYAPDVNVVIEKLDDAHFTNVVVSDVETTPWYLEILPYAIGFVLIFILFTMMTSQAQGGGGGNAKMMNFGKSRARMTAPDEKSKTFADVAGLVEEKEQLEEIAEACNMEVVGTTQVISDGKWLNGFKIKSLLIQIRRKKFDILLINSPYRISIYPDVYEEFETICRLYNVKVLTYMDYISK